MDSAKHESHEIVARTFSEVKPSLSYSDEMGRPFSYYFDKPAVVLLGAPGAGKTECFRQAAQIEPTAQYVTIRDFLTFPAKEWRGKVLYLDGLDEQRSRTMQGSDVIDNVRAKLYDLGCPKFSIYDERPALSGPTLFELGLH